MHVLGWEHFSVCSASFLKGVRKRVNSEIVQGEGNLCIQRETVVLGDGLLNSQREERETYRDFQIMLIREEGNCTLPSLLKKSGDFQTD